MDKKTSDETEQKTLFLSILQTVYFFSGLSIGVIVIILIFYSSSDIMKYSSQVEDMSLSLKAKYESRQVILTSFEDSFKYTSFETQVKNEVQKYRILIQNREKQHVLSTTDSSELLTPLILKYPDTQAFQSLVPFSKEFDENEDTIKNMEHNYNKLVDEYNKSVSKPTNVILQKVFKYVPNKYPRLTEENK